MVTWSGGGNAPPMVELARRLADRGHQVTLCAPADVCHRVVGTPVQVVVPENVPSGAASISPLEAEQRIMEATLFGAASAADVRRILHDARTEIAVVDCMHGAAFAAAQSLGVPTAVFLHFRYGFFTEPPIGPFIDEWIRPLLADARSAMGLPPLATDRSVARQLWDPAEVAISMVTPSLETPLAAQPANLVHAGPLFERPPERTRLEVPRTRVMVSFSTTNMDQGETVSRVVTALGQLDVDGLVTLGGVKLSLAASPDNVRVVDWIDPVDVLPSTSVVVTHAGMGTVLTTLAHGVPMVAMGMGRDQDGNAARVAEIGAGLSLPPNASVGDIASAIEQVAAGATFANAAGRVADEIASLGGGVRAVKAVESLAS